ncbi:putative transferase [Medicago truncatula]|uniref:Putative transferase n=1 Tax=Medicago truncatula TaxID=3880 RepID=A0A396GFA1_MEDTR|nr:putative transferase [Medicago truncatula]
MGMLLHFLLVLFGVLPTIFVLIQAQDQSGFISIDCGLPAHLNYSALDTGISYISDAKFIDTGVTKRILSTEIILKQLLEYVRSFPTSFYYGNYDNLNQPPQFDLHFGANVWDTVNFPNVSVTTTREIIYTPSLDYIQPCLVNTGSRTPFISAIELRSLNNTAYGKYSDKSSVLSLSFRSDIGSITNLQYRYKDDVNDRIWFPFQLNEMKRLSTNEDLLGQGSYKLPAIVMSTAAIPVNASAPLQLEWETYNVNDRFYLYMHFNEVEELAANETREFNITVNDKFWFGPEIPGYRSVNTISSIRPLTGAKRYQISLYKTENSTLPPILNAYEVY